MSAGIARRVAVLLLAGACLAASACESTQDLNKKLAKNGDLAFKQKGLTVTRRNPSVKVLSTTVLTDQNGTAAIIELRNDSNRTLVDVPIAIDVLGPDGKSVFKNNLPGLAPSLTEAALLTPGEEFAWVHDQVQPDGTASSVKPAIGIEAGTATGPIPSISTTPPRFEVDPTSGVNVAGEVTNNSNVTQLKLVIFAVSKKDGRFVAAGRGEIQRLKPHAHAPFHIYFIGEPRGGQVTLVAPPTTLK